MHKLGNELTADDKKYQQKSGILVKYYDTYLPYIVDEDYDRSYPEQEMQLLCRLDDLHDHLEELIAKDAPYRNWDIYSEDDIAILGHCQSPQYFDFDR